jgi:hypothetical protein
VYSKCGKEVPCVFPMISNNKDIFFTKNNTLVQPPPKKKLNKQEKTRRPWE